jgi:hypothetical protein
MLFMGTTPYAEFYVYAKLVIPGKPAETVANIMANKPLFISAIFGYLVNFIADLVAAWAFYGLLRPVHAKLSLLTAWFRVVYTVISLAALLHLLTVLRLLEDPGFPTLFGTDRLNAMVMLSIHDFRDGWSLAYYFFGIHLMLLDYLMFKSGYVPRIIGILQILDGLGWIITELQPILFPNTNLGFVAVTYFGELILLLWLFIKGSRIRELSVP